MKKKEFTYKQSLIRMMPHSVIRVLIENKLFEAYVKNAVEFMKLRTVATYQPDEYFLYAFRWSSTPEGWETWHEIYLKIISL